VVEQHRAGRDFWAVLGEFLDEFYAAAGDRRSTIEQEPATDGYVGAVGEHLAQCWHLHHIPQWTSAKERFLDWPWFPGADTPKLHMIQLMYSPIAFRWQDNFTRPEPLRRPGMPSESRAIGNEEIVTDLLRDGGDNVQVRIVVGSLLHLDYGK
jgi:hypothetical protein